METVIVVLFMCLLSFALGLYVGMKVKRAWPWEEQGTLPGRVQAAIQETHQEARTAIQNQLQGGDRSGAATPPR
jgi:hypothetical protein